MRQKQAGRDQMVANARGVSMSSYICESRNGISVLLSVSTARFQQTGKDELLPSLGVHKSVRPGQV
jgi:hypothetical protein